MRRKAARSAASTIAQALSGGRSHCHLLGPRGEAARGVRAKGLALGANGYMSKPARPQALLSAIKIVLGLEVE